VISISLQNLPKNGLYLTLYTFLRNAVGVQTDICALTMLIGLIDSLNFIAPPLRLKYNPTISPSQLILPNMLWSPWCLQIL